MLAESAVLAMTREIHSFGWKALKYGVAACLFAACSSSQRDFAEGSAGASASGNSMGGSAAGGSASGGRSGRGSSAGESSSDDAGAGGMQNSGPGQGTGASAEAGAAGGPALGEGLPCSADSECESGHCRDEVCCATGCPGPCEACAEALTALPDGTCASVVSGMDPHDDCEKSAAESCGHDGTCDGQGACRNYGTNQICRAASCSNSSYSPASTCDGEGACSEPEAVECGEFPCSDEGCQTPCTENEDCPALSYCAGDICRNQRTDGEACSDGAECRSGACVDGVCCQSACDLSCQACSKATTGLANGICGARLGSASKPCTLDGTATCVDVTSDVDNCGACGNECSGSSLPGTAPVCNASTCGVSCPEGTLGDGSNVCIPVTTVAAGPAFACGLQTDGHVKCWGNTTDTGLSPAGLSNLILKSITAGRDFVCGIRDNGLAYCWGDNAPSVESGTFYALAAGENHVCGIKSNRTLDCWTRGSDGTDSPPTGTFQWLASGTDYSCAIVQGGNLEGRGTCWGAGTVIVSNFPSTSNSETYAQMWGGGLGSWGLRDDGTATSWGKIQFSPPSGTIFKALAHGATQNRCGILTDGSVTCWGTPGSEATIPPSGTFKAIAMGGSFACGVKSNGAMTCWGANDLGQAPGSVAGTFQGYW